MIKFKIEGLTFGIETNIENPYEITEISEGDKHFLTGDQEHDNMEGVLGEIINATVKHKVNEGKIKSLKTYFAERERIANLVKTKLGLAKKKS